MKNENQMTTTRPQKVNPSVTARISRKNLRTFEFYSKHYEIPVAMLLQSEVYNQTVVLSEDVFGCLEYMEANASLDDPEEITLEFCPDAMALLRRVSELLRWRLEDLASDLLSVSAANLANYIQRALLEDGMFGDNMSDLADWAIDFHRHARQNKTPGSADVPNGWDLLNLKPPPRRGKRTKAMA